MSTMAETVLGSLRQPRFTPDVCQVCSRPNMGLACKRTPGWSRFIHAICAIANPFVVFTDRRRLMMPDAMAHDRMQLDRKIQIAYERDLDLLSVKPLTLASIFQATNLAFPEAGVSFELEPE